MRMAPSANAPRASDRIRRGGRFFTAGGASGADRVPVLHFPAASADGPASSCPGLPFGPMGMEPARRSGHSALPDRHAAAGGQLSSQLFTHRPYPLDSPDPVQTSFFFGSTSVRHHRWGTDGEGRVRRRPGRKVPKRKRAMRWLVLGGVTRRGLFLACQPSRTREPAFRLHRNGMGHTAVSREFDPLPRLTQQCASGSGAPSGVILIACVCGTRSGKAVMAFTSSGIRRHHCARRMFMALRYGSGSDIYDNAVTAKLKLTGGAVQT